MTKTIVVVAALLCGASAAMAQTHPGATIQDLYQQCQAPDASENAALCLGYVSGVSDMMSGFGNTVRKSNLTASQKADYSIFGICTEIFTHGQAQQVFINWAQKNPTEWQLDAVQGVILALREAWPCK